MRKNRRRTDDLVENVPNRYFRWLCGLVESNRPDHEYRELLRWLHAQKFYEMHPMDANRASDGRRLRNRFAQEELGLETVFEGDVCSILEMLIALSERMDFILYRHAIGKQTARWFYELISNLELKTFSDAYAYSEGEHYSNAHVIKKLLTRTYSRSGQGGLFPLKRKCLDQRNVEIWDQLASYIDENYADY